MSKIALATAVVALTAAVSLTMGRAEGATAGARRRPAIGHNDVNDRDEAGSGPSRDARHAATAGFCRIGHHDADPRNHDADSGRLPPVRPRHRLAGDRHIAAGHGGAGARHRQSRLDAGGNPSRLGLDLRQLPRARGQRGRRSAPGAAARNHRAVSPRRRRNQPIWSPRSGYRVDAPSANSISELVGIFQNVRSSVTVPRLPSNDTT
jgi:hypothetical protein